jgi:hypothetical protein
MNLPPEIQARRAVEDQAAQLGAERQILDDRTIANTRAIMALLPEAEDVGVPLEQLSVLVRVSRQTLHRWRLNVPRLQEEANPQNVSVTVQELVPPSEVFTSSGARPTLRQAIVMVFRGGHRDQAWKPTQVIDALEQNGWLPEARSASQMVRNRMHSMVEREQLIRDALGNYSLPPAYWATGGLPPELD